MNGVTFENVTRPPEPIEFPSICRLLVGWIRDRFDVHASSDVPNPRPDLWVRVLRTGGPRAGLVVDRAQVTIETWADTDLAAEDLALAIRPHLAALGGRRIDGQQINRAVEASGPAQLPDPTSGQHRWTWTVELDVRGHPLPL